MGVRTLGIIGTALAALAGVLVVLGSGVAALPVGAGAAIAAFAAARRTRGGDAEG